MLNGVEWPQWTTVVLSSNKCTWLYFFTSNSCYGVFSEVLLLVWIPGKPEPQQQFGRLQRIQKAAARFITCTLWQEHISPVLMQLHWLKVPQRITFKILTLTFLAIHGKAPTYICELVEQHTFRRELRWTSNEIMMKQPRSRTAAGDRAFVTAAPRLWNCLPADIRCITTISSFKKHLKTYLFNEGYKQLQ